MRLEIFAIHRAAVGQRHNLLAESKR